MAERGHRPARRRLLRVLAVAALLAPPLARGLANTPGLAPWGRGEFRFLGFTIYEAELWAAGELAPAPPLALRLTYRRSLAGAEIARASVREMRRLGAAEPKLERWGEWMARVFPDVKPGDHLVGIHEGAVARFQQAGRDLGSLAEAEFADRFFGIWLDPRTRAPDLRAELLRRPAP
jgi:hypothetical protein